MSTIISNAGLKLSILENEINNNMLELRRWEARQLEAAGKVAECQARLSSNLKSLEAVKKSIPVASNMIPTTSNRTFSAMFYLGDFN